MPASLNQSSPQMPCNPAISSPLLRPPAPQNKSTNVISDAWGLSQNLEMSAQLMTSDFFFVSLAVLFSVVSLNGVFSIETDFDFIVSMFVSKYSLSTRYVLFIFIVSICPAATILRVAFNVKPSIFATSEIEYVLFFITYMILFCN